MCANIEIFDKKVLLFGTIEEKRELFEMKKEKKDIFVGIKIPRSFLELLKKRAEAKQVKFQASSEIFELAMNAIQFEINPIVDKVQSEKEKRALEVLDKIKRVIKEEGV